MTYATRGFLEIPIRVVILDTDIWLTPGSKPNVSSISQLQWEFLEILKSLNMLEDVILLDIDGISPIRDTYSFDLDIASPGQKRVVLHFKDITHFIQYDVNSLDTIVDIIEADDVARMDDTSKTEPTIDIKMEDSEVINNEIKTEDTKAEELNGVTSLPTW
ncbi:hypothetical protein BDR06DRAFT_966548 [Suillus hirtellus]|nr:hypothetical protein BDR06DRAFT_966548 [Suillus hirtellus]